MSDKTTEETRTDAPEPESHPTPPKDSKPKPQPAWKIQFMMAWDNWLKYIVIPAVGVAIAAAIILTFFNNDHMGLVFAALIALAPLVAGQRQIREFAMRSAWRFGLTVVLVLGLVAGALYPILQPVISGDGTQHFSFNKAEDSVELPPMGSEQAWWLFEVHASLPESSEPISVPYIFHFKNDQEKQTVKGELKRSWRKVRIGRRGRGKALSSKDRKIHRVTADLSKPTTLALTKLDGKINGPLEVFLRAEPVRWIYLLGLDLPLIALAGILDALEKQKKRNGLFAGKSAFMLLFSAVFADNWILGVWIGPIFMGLFAGGVAALVTIYLLRGVFRRLVGAFGVRAS